MLYNIKYKQTDPDATFPMHPRPGDVGIDLYAARDSHIPAGKHGKVYTGIAFELPDNIFLYLKDRSSMCQDVHVVGGVIDTSYRGEIVVVMYNTNPFELFIKRGAKIAQAVPHFAPSYDLIQTVELAPSLRGEKGFGSTGK